MTGGAPTTLLPSTDPGIWGPPTWATLHLMAEGYPDHPTPPVARHCAAFLEALPWMLPCEACGFHARRFLKAYPGGAERIAVCRDSLRCFLVELHNSVAVHTRPEAPEWSPARAARFYATGRRTTPAPPEWTTGSRLVRQEQGFLQAAEAPRAPGQCACSTPPTSPR